MSIAVINLQCDYHKNPIGIDNCIPRLSWNMKAGGTDRSQSAYRIVARCGENVVWDTGKVECDKSVGIRYEGAELKSRMRINWKVCIWDEKGEQSDWSEEAFFEMGLLNSEDWSAEWISAPEEISAPYFRKEIDCTTEIASARAYICGLGYYELYINGTKTGDWLLTPNRTDYVVRMFYHTFDITELLKSGKNVIGIEIGNGWYNQKDKINEKKLWYGYPKLLLQTEITYTDGTTETIGSDESFVWKASPRIYNNIYFGEIYDASKESCGWKLPGYDASGWSGAMKIWEPGGKLVAQKSPSDQVIGYIEPKTVTEVRPGMYVIDFGQCMTGWVSMKVRGTKGEKVQLRFGEELWPNGSINYYSTGSGWTQQKDVYFLSGEGEESYEPKFTWHGFRYVEIQGYPGIPDRKDFRAVVVYAGVEKTGQFRCSDAMINQIQKASIWSMTSSLHGGVPLDSPHRERQGYGGDALTTAKALIYGYQMQGFYTDWMNDFADEQDKETGFIPHTIPCQDGGGGPAWGCAYIVISWLLYRYYGDTKTTEDNYDGMIHWMKFLQTGMVDGIVEGEGADKGCLGEWSTPGEILIPPRFVNTFFYAYCAKLLTELGTAIGRTEDAEVFRAEYERITLAFRNEFYDSRTGKYSIGAQGTEAFAAVLGAIREQEKELVSSYLSGHVERDCNGNLDTGILGTPFLFDTLVQMGLGDQAFNMITSTTYPSYGYMITNGATTLWEYWEKEYGFYQCPGNHNQAMFGSISGWFYERLAGIAPLEPAYKKIAIHPNPIGALRFVTASVNTPYGEVCVDWEKDDDALLVNIKVPANTTAELTLPGRETLTVGSGNHKFSFL